ncbi:MAG TPA: response regulator [Candidatus Binatia bacterium]|nr:response regulator [Candidatus Binatia bacterium]
MPSSKASRTVLVVEDSEDDILLLSMTLRQANIPWRIANALPDGEQAIAWLEQAYLSGAPESRCEIDLLLVDLKMPRKDGFDVLRWVKTRLPGRFRIVVFSSSLVLSDIARARELGADFYYIKPVSSEERLEVVRHLEHSLFSSELPWNEDETTRHFESMLNSAL